MKGYIEFEFDLPGALLVQLIKTIDGLEAVALSAENLADIPEQQGIYQIFSEGKLVYIGKTDAESGLRKRLVRHAKKIRHRVGLDISKIHFKAVRIFVFTAMDLESDLIRHYGGVKTIDWNGSGFGANDPGRERDTTNVDPDNYDAKFPIDIDRDISFVIEVNETAAVVAQRLKSALPFLFRYQGRGGKSRKAHLDFEQATLTAISGPISTRNIIKHIVSALPPGWQATALPGYVIMYKEALREYPQSQVIAVSA